MDKMCRQFAVLLIGIFLGIPGQVETREARIAPETSLYEPLPGGARDSILYYWDLADQTQDGQLTFLSTESGAMAGFQVGAGDVNGDGYQDVLVSAPNAEPPGRTDAGAVYLFFGPLSLSGTEHLNLAPVTIVGETNFNIGYGLALGDINNDGMDDIIIGAPFANTTGMVFVVYGAASLPSTIDLSTYSCLRIFGVDINDIAGGSVSAGDINNDGFEDVIIAAPSGDGPGNMRADAGEYYVVLGALDLPDSIYLSLDANMTIYGAESGDGSVGGTWYPGHQISNGDLNGDGFSDITIGAPGADGAGNNSSNCGEIYIIWGANTPPAIVDLAFDADVILYGVDPDDHCVRHSTGDFNMDGIDDLFIGARDADGPGNIRPDAGEIYILYGRSTWQSSISLETDSDVIIYGSDPGDVLGRIAVADLNNDGRMDLMLGAPGGDGSNNTRPGTGEAYLVLGDTVISSVIDLDTHPYILISGADNGDALTGYNAFVCADIDNDGITDMILGASFADGEFNAYANAGEAYVVNGIILAQASILVQPDQQDSTSAGVSISYLLDVINNGNRDDVIDITAVTTLPNWTVNLFYSDSITPLADNDGDGLVDVDTLPGFGGSIQIVATVIPPADAEGGDIDTTTITGISSNNPSISDQAMLITMVKTPLIADISVEPDRESNTAPGLPVYYDLWVVNNGNAQDSVILTSSYTSPNWSVEIYDTDTIPLSSVVLAPFGGRSAIIVKITPPDGAKSDTLLLGVDSTYIIGISSNIPTIIDSALLVTELYLVGNLIVEPDSNLCVNPGDTASYTIWVKNLGNFKDIIDLQVSHTQPDWGFDIPLMDNNGNGLDDVDSLSPPDSVSFILKVTPPPNAPAGITDTTEIVVMYARVPESQDTVVLITRVGYEILGIDIESNQTGEVFSEQSIYYHLTVTWFSNFSDIINIKTERTENGWTIELLDADRRPLFDSNGDGIRDIGRVTPYTYYDFTVKITSPRIIGLDIVNTDINTITVYAISAFKNSVYDSVLLTTALKWELDIWNFASPFAEKTRFVLSLPEDGDVDLTVYNRLGKKVKTVIDGGTYLRGIHMVPWEGMNDYGKRVAPGVYIYLFEFRGKSGSHREIMKKTAIIPE